MNQHTAALRRVYFEAWQKALNNDSLTEIEIILVDVIQRHPEYHEMLANKQNYLLHENTEYQLSENPFFHLALHVAIIEQVNTDRPLGIQAIYQKLLIEYLDKTEIEHRMIDCLIPFLNDTSPDVEKRYLEMLMKL